MVARYAVAACLLVALSASAGVAALESGNLAYLSPVVELPGLAKDGAQNHVHTSALAGYTLDSCLPLDGWSDGQQSSNVNLCFWCRACECTCAQPQSAVGPRPQAPGPSQVRMGVAHQAQQGHSVRPGEQELRRYARVTSSLQLQEQEVQLRGADVPSCCPCEICSYCNASITILVSHPRDVPRQQQPCQPMDSPNSEPLEC